MTIKEVAASIPERKEGASDAAVRHWNALAKPLGGLGVLEENITKISALTGREDVRLDRRTLLVICADNGVTAQGVSQTDGTVTSAVAAALGGGVSTVNYMAGASGCRVVPVDVGMQGETPAGVLNKKIRCGTDDISLGPAMTRKECEQAILLGVELAREQSGKGTDILLLGEMGIGNTTTSAAVACVLLGMEADSCAGRGAGLSDAGLTRKRDVIRCAIRRNRPDPADPVDVLQKVGGLDLAVLCGVCMGGAACRMPVLLDGMITNAAALCAVRLCGRVSDALLASHVSEEPAAGRLLKELQLEPCISAKMHLGEGSGAVLALPLLDQALAVYHSGRTFEVLGIEAYTPQGEVK